VNENPNADLIMESVERWIRIVKRAREENRDVSVEEVEQVRRESESMENVILG